MIRNIVKRAYVSNSTDDSGDYPTIQISYLSPLKTAIAERISPYGLYTNLPKDIQVLVFSVQGNEENKACIGYSQTDRFKNLKEGEVLIGNPQTQCFVKFDKDGNIDITCGSRETLISHPKMILMLKQ
jgi:phage gp45-like